MVRGINIVDARTSLQYFWYQRDSVRWNEVVKKVKKQNYDKKISLIFFFLFFIQYFIGHQSNMLAKGIKFYVGKFELSDIKFNTFSQHIGLMSYEILYKKEKEKYKRYFFVIILFLNFFNYFVPSNAITLIPKIL